MSRIAYLAILDFGFWILDFKPRIKSLPRRTDPPVAENSRITSRFTLHALLFLTCALQIPIFAAGNSDGLVSPDAAGNSPPKAGPPQAEKSQIANRKSELPSALEILAQVRSALPREALFIKGQILSGGRLGKLERACYIEMLLELGEDPATVQYKLSDAFGTPFEQMTISMAEGGEAEFEYERGNPLRPAAAPPPAGVIRDTDVTWNDLSLLFLWRTDARTVRAESLRGRDCYVIEFPSNAVIQNPKSKIQNQRGGTKVIWIDMQMLLFIQMEDLDREGKLQRRLTIKNIKKISDQWMIKNMEIRSYPALHHTLIRIDDIVHGPQSTVDGPQSTVNDK